MRFFHSNELIGLTFLVLGGLVSGLAFACGVSPIFGMPLTALGGSLYAMGDREDSR